MERKMFKSLIVSMIFMYVATTIGVFVDGLVIGMNLGDNTMAAYGLSSPLILILLAITDIFAGGSQNVCAGAMGKGDMDRANKTFSAVLIVITALGILLGVLMNVFLGPICRILGAAGDNAKLYGDLSEYVRGLSFAIPAMLLALVVTMIQQLEGYMMPTILGVIAMTVVNVALDLMNVFVFHGGMFGMALATVASYYSGAVVLFLGFLKKGLMFKPSVRNISFSEISQVIRVGVPGAFERACYAVRGIAYNKILLAVAGAQMVGSITLGAMSVAAFAVYSTLNNLFGSVCFGVESATLTVVGILFGEENKTALKRLLGTSMKWMVILNTAVAAVLFAVAPLLVGFFTEDAETQKMAANCVRILSLSMPFTGANAVLKKFLQGMRRTNLTSAYSIVEIVVVTIASGAAMGALFGVYGVFYGYLVGEFIMLIIYFALCVFGKKSENFVFFPKGFDVPEKDLFEGMAATVEQVSEISQGTMEFCREHGADAHQAMAISLSVEEMADNIIHHGFSDGKEHHIEYRIIYKNGGFTLRLRDDCRRFNPVDWMNAVKKKDEQDEGQGREKHIGIRLVYKMVKDIQYVNSMSTNNTIIKV